MTRDKITCRFHSHARGIEVEARINDGDWHAFECVPSWRFKPGCQAQWPALFMRALRAQGFDVCWVPVGQ